VTDKGSRRIPYWGNALGNIFLLVKGKRDYLSNILKRDSLKPFLMIAPPNFASFFAEKETDLSKKSLEELRNLIDTELKNK